MPAVLLKICTELRGQHGLFSPRFNPISKNNQEDPYHASPAVNRQGGPDRSQIESRIDGMPKPRVRPRADQFVILFDCDAGAPILSQMPACPQCERNPGPSECNARDTKSVGTRDHSMAEDPNLCVVAEEQNEAGNFKNRMP